MKQPGYVSYTFVHRFTRSPGHRKFPPNARLCNLCARNIVLPMCREPQGNSLQSHGPAIETALNKARDRFKSCQRTSTPRGTLLSWRHPVICMLCLAAFACLAVACVSKPLEVSSQDSTHFSHVSLDGIWRGDFDIEGRGPFDFTALHVNGKAYAYSRRAGALYAGGVERDGEIFTSTYTLFLRGRSSTGCRHDHRRSQRRKQDFLALCHNERAQYRDPGPCLRCGV